MLSEYYILQLHFPESKKRTIATIFNPIFPLYSSAASDVYKRQPIFLLIFFCRLIKKLYLCNRIFSKNQALRLIENRIFSKYM